jgi:hypothetical protein
VQESGEKLNINLSLSAYGHQAIKENEHSSKNKSIVPQTKLKIETNTQK